MDAIISMARDVANSSPLMQELTEYLAQAAFAGNTAECAEIRNIIMADGVSSRDIGICVAFGVAMVAGHIDTANYLAEWMRELPFEKRAPTIFENAKWSPECVMIARDLNAHSAKLAHVTAQIAERAY